MLGGAFRFALVLVLAREVRGKLKGDLAECYSIRITDPWRIIFTWNSPEAGPGSVRIVDYH